MHKVFKNKAQRCSTPLRAPKWVHCLFLFAFVQGKYNCHMQNCLFLSSLDDFLLKNVIIFFVGNQISKWCSFEKRKKGLFLTYFSHILSHQGRETKIPSAYISLTYIHIFCSPYWLFFASPILQKLWIYHIWFLFGVTPSISFFFPVILEQSINNRMVSKVRLECLLLIFIYIKANLTVICKPRTLNDSRWRLCSVQKMQKSTVS